MDPDQTGLNCRQERSTPIWRGSWTQGQTFSHLRKNIFSHLKNSFCSKNSPRQDVNPPFQAKVALFVGDWTRPQLRQLIRPEKKKAEETRQGLEKRLWIFFNVTEIFRCQLCWMSKSSQCLPGGYIVTHSLCTRRLLAILFYMPILS